MVAEDRVAAGNKPVIMSKITRDKTYMCNVENELHLDMTDMETKRAVKNEIKEYVAY